MIVYDTHHKRLAVFEQEASPEFWDAQWDDDRLHQNISSGKTHHFIKRITKRYVPKGGKILEGGCGTGQVVYAIRQWGYDAMGIDFAEQTVARVRELFPNLPLTIGDVRKTEFPPATFDGYWSLGVIEHFWDGYSDIIQEAHRVLKPGGSLFLSFPVMSPLRKLKARLGLYPLLGSTTPTDQFYEFMLDARGVKTSVEKVGFMLAHTEYYDALKGMKDETRWGKEALQKLYKSHHPAARALRLVFTLLCARLTGHMALLVFKKV